MGSIRSIDRRKRRHALAGSCGSTSGSCPSPTCSEEPPTCPSAHFVHLIFELERSFFEYKLKHDLAKEHLNVAAKCGIWLGNGK